MQALTLTLLITALVASGACERFQNGAAVSARYPLDVAGEHFKLEIAADDATRARGLQHRSEIAPDGGMVFAFPRPAIQSFWMADCLVDIDIVFLDPGGRVTSLHRMKAEAPQRDGEAREAYEARMHRYSSIYPAQYAVEFKAGTLDRLGLRVDSKVPLDTSRLKALAR